MSNVFQSKQLQRFIGVVKTLQHTTNLSMREEEAFHELTDTYDEFAARVISGMGEKRGKEFLGQNGWISPLLLIVDGDPKLNATNVRIALKSMKRGRPTFLDQDIAARLIDVMFKMMYVSRLEEEAIGRSYV